MNARRPHESQENYRARLKAQRRAVNDHLMGRMLWVSKPVYDFTAGPGRTLNIEKETR